MTPEQEQRVLNEAGAMFAKLQTDAMRLGAKMICSVVLDLAHADVSDEQKLKSIAQFCEVTLGNTDKE